MQVFPFEIWKIFKNTFFYRIPPMAASEIKEIFNFLRFSLWLCSIFAFINVFVWHTWFYKQYKFHSLQMENEKKAFTMDMFQYPLC